MSMHEHKHTTVSVHALFKWLWKSNITLYSEPSIPKPSISKTFGNTPPRYSFLPKSVCDYFDTCRSNIQ